MADEKQMNAIRFFCKHPYSDHGVKRAPAKGSYYHDWSDLVQQISYFDCGHTQKDEATIKAVARLCAKEFPSDENWTQITDAPGAHERILSIIRNGLAAQLALKPEGA
jgi:hypothetical protein